MSRNQFINTIEYKRYSVSNHTAKILGIDYGCVELLKPIAFKEGAILTFAIRNDDYSRQYQDLSGNSDSDRNYRIDLDRIKNAISSEIKNSNLSKAIAQLYKLKGEVKICGLESRWQKETRNQMTMVMPKEGTISKLINIKSIKYN